MPAADRSSLRVVVFFSDGSPITLPIQRCPTGSIPHEPEEELRVVVGTPWIVTAGPTRDNINRTSTKLASEIMRITR
jgi:hypothetical protein